METATALVTFAEWWGWIGLAVAVGFLTVGIDRIDENARGAYLMRPLLVPGIVLIWPLVLWRWWVIAKGEDHAARHRPPVAAQAWLGILLGLIIPVMLFGGLVLRQDGPNEAPAVMLAPPEDAG